MRDLHVVHWLSLSAIHRDLNRTRNLRKAREFLVGDPVPVGTIRAGRDSNVLTFDLQRELSGLIAAAWMREYYR